MKLRRLGSVLLLGWFVTAAVACGGEQTRLQAPGIPGGAAEPEPTTLAEAEAQLDRAQAELDSVALNDTGAATASPAGAAAPSAPPAPAPAAAPSRSEASESAADKAAEAPAAAEPNPCETACKAFSSLTRASDAVCRLETASVGGKRCERAKQLRESAAQRVASCGCGK